MQKNSDRRLIEDYLPIEAISAEASREKSIRKGHISTLHLWWARIPLVTCRAAIYSALVPASRFVPNNGADNKKKSLGRANSARFVKGLCRYPSETKPEDKISIERAIQEAQRHVLATHAERLTAELADWKAGQTGKPGWVDEFKWKPACCDTECGAGRGETVTIEDIVAGRAPRPRVMDMFAGGGTIPLEALRLGCEAYANDLNPVAHIIQLCTLVYPQKYGKPDPTARGMTGPKNEKGETTWGGLADEVRCWGDWVLNKVKAEIGDLYPLIPDPDYKGKKPALQPDWFKEHDTEDVPAGYLMPAAYFWTRTVRCKNPSCRATVPLVKQTWLCKKDGKYIAMRMIAPKGKKEVRFEIVETPSEARLGFDPTAFSKAGNASCPFCNTVADSDYVKVEGCEKRIGEQLMAIACTRPGARGKVYLSLADAPTADIHEEAIVQQLKALCGKTGLTVPNEPIVTDAKNSCWTPLYGFSTFGDIFTPRQKLCLLHFCCAVRSAEQHMKKDGISQEHTLAIATSLGILVDRVASQSNTCCIYHTGGEKIENSLGARSLPLTWDFVEANPLGNVTGSAANQIDWIVAVYEELQKVRNTAALNRGSAVELPYADASIDAVITDPPYYDNVPYANLSDFFFAWMKRSIGHLYPAHFAGTATPKKSEAVADATRHGGSKDAARKAYEKMMAAAFAGAHRALKPSGEMVVVYAHKTTLGWSTLVDALRGSGFTVVEAWPVIITISGGKVKVGKAMLADAIFLVARKRDATSKAGNYEADVVPELGNIVRERVDTLWDMGISGADLVIACVGAGLRAFTKYPRVEFANGEEVPAERFLMEVETVVLEAILGKLSKTVGAKAGLPAAWSVAQAGATLSGLDPATRFYVLWRYTYGGAELDAGEAIIFANGTHVELDGPHGLSTGVRRLVEKKKGKYKLLDFTERGQDEKLGISEESQAGSPTVDALHRILWLVAHKPPKIPDFLNETKPNVEQLRLVAQALAGPALKGGELADVSPSAEQSALGKLLANWNAVMVGKAAMADKRAGQQQLL